MEDDVLGSVSVDLFLAFDDEATRPEEVGEFGFGLAQEQGGVDLETLFLVLALGSGRLFERLQLAFDAPFRRHR